MTKKLIEKLLAGHKSYQQNYLEKNKSLITNLSENGQNPEIAVISCCDSRVIPEFIFDCSPGDLFVIRNVANIVPRLDSSINQSTISALEYAVQCLKVKAIIILGHTHCGGIKALMDDNKDLGITYNWLQQLAPVRQRVLENNIQSSYLLAEKDAIRFSLNNLLSFPWILEPYRKKHLEICGYIYNLKTCSLEEVK